MNYANKQIQSTFLSFPFTKNQVSVKIGIPVQMKQLGSSKIYDPPYVYVSAEVS